MSSSEPNKLLVPDARPEIIHKSVEQSLLRLQIDRIDLYYRHRTNQDIVPEEVDGVMVRWHEKLFMVLEEWNIGFLAFSPLANRFLSSKYNAQSVLCLHQRRLRK